MHLEIQRCQLEYLAKVVQTFKIKCKAKSTVVYLIFKDDCSEFIYSSENFFVKLKIDYIAEFKGEYSLDLELIKNMLILFDSDDIIEIDFRDRLIVTHQGEITLKGQVAGRPNYNTFKIDEQELHEVPIEFNLSNKLLTLDLEELSIANQDPYVHLYNVSKDKLIKMSSFCALIQTLEKPATQEVTLTQDILNICSIVSDKAHYFRYQNSFYIKDVNLEIKMPLANIRFPSLDAIINKVKTGSECFIIDSEALLDVCNKCHSLNIKNKLNRVDMVFKNGLAMYSYNAVLTGSFKTELEFDWKMSFNPLLMRGILKYINEEYVTIRKNNNTNTILIHNSDNTITFMLALCK